MPITNASNTLIFTNLDRISDTLYLFGAGLTIAGNQVSNHDETWLALPFTLKANYHANTLAAAIGWVSGTKLINMGIYSDNAGKVGTLLPGAQGSTSQIADLGDCCDLAKVNLPGAGVQLSAGIQYWLVAGPDNSLGPTFKGEWQTSTLAVSAYQEPENVINWSDFGGTWLAAEIRGTSP